MISQPLKTRKQKDKGLTLPVSPSSYCTVSLLPLKTKALTIRICTCRLQFLSIWSHFHHVLTPVTPPELAHPLPSPYPTTSSTWQTWSPSPPWKHLFPVGFQSTINLLLILLPQWNFYWFLLISQISNSRNAPNHFSLFKWNLGI